MSDELLPQAARPVQPINCLFCLDLISALYYYPLWYVHYNFSYQQLLTCFHSKYVCCISRNPSHIRQWIKESNKEVVRDIYNVNGTDLDECCLQLTSINKEIADMYSTIGRFFVPGSNPSSVISVHYRAPSSSASSLKLMPWIPCSCSRILFLGGVTSGRSL